MNLPARLRRWDVHGESLAVEGTAADVILDWIGDDEDETAKIQINRLMGVIYNTDFYYISILTITILILLRNLFFRGGWWVGLIVVLLSG